MTRMLIFATDLVQITGATGSQIRMEMYARVGNKMATYLFWQQVQSSVEDQIDMVLIDGMDPKTSASAKKNVKLLGESQLTSGVTGYGDDVNQFTNNRGLSPAVLTFLRSASDTTFLASLNIDIGGPDPQMIITFRFKGELDPGAYHTRVPGKLGRIKGRFDFLIDL